MLEEIKGEDELEIAFMYDSSSLIVTNASQSSEIYFETLTKKRLRELE